MRLFPVEAVMADIHSRRAERRSFLSFLLFLLTMLACIALPLWLGAGYPLTTRIAAIGGSVAAIGGLSVLRPLLRVGGPFWGEFNLITLEIYEREVPILLNDADREVLERFRNPVEVLEDARAVRFGALLVALGTVINGFSGFAS